MSKITRNLSNSLSYSPSFPLTGMGDNIPDPVTFRILGTDFSETASNVPVRFKEDNYDAPANWNGEAHFTIDGVQPKQRVNATPIIQNDVQWTWFNRPEAVYANGYTFITWFAFSDNTWRIGRYEHSTKTWTTTNLGNDGGSYDNDHNSPCIVIDDNGTVHVFASEHTTSATYHFVSDSAYDISSFTTNVLSALSTTVTYPQAQLMDGNNIALTWREGNGSDRPRKIAIYDVDGDSWGSGNDFVDEGSGTRPYIHIITDPNDDDKLHVVFSNDHPREISQGSNDLYHGYYLLSTGSIYETDGTLIGAIGTEVFSSSNGTLVEDASTRGYNFWSADITIASDGHPVIVYSEHEDQENIRYRYAKYNGTSWAAHEIAFAGQSLYGVFSGNPEPQYIPGMTVADGGETVFYSRDADNGQHRVYKATTSDNGATWTETLISPKGGREKIRPVAVRNANAELQCVYMTGNFTTYLDMHMDLAVYPHNAAQNWHMDAVVEVDTDGNNIDLTFNYSGATLDEDFTDEITVVDNESSMRKLTDVSNPIDGLSDFVVLGAFNATSFDTNNYIVSDWDGSVAANRSIALRIGSADEYDFIIETTSGTVTLDTGSNLTASTGTDTGVAARLTGDVMSIAANGTLSTVTQAASNPVVTKTGGTDVMGGTSPHDATMFFDGEIPYVGFYSGAKTDAWLQMASEGIKGHEFVEATPPPSGDAITVDTYDSASDTSDLSTYTFSGVTVSAGTVIVAVAGRNSGGLSSYSVTIGGDAMTPIGSIDMYDTNKQGTQFFYRENVTGSSADIVVTANNTMFRLGIHAWSLSNADMSTAIVESDGSTTDADLSTPTVDIDVVNNGVALAIGYTIQDGGTASLSWSGLTQREAWTNYGDTVGSGAADLAISTTETDRTVTCTVTNGKLHMLSVLSLEAD